MPFVLLILGEMLLVSGIVGSQGDFFNLLKGDFTGQGSFIYWLGAIAIVGAVGYIPKLKPLSNAFLVLILVVLILHQNPQTLFKNFNLGLSSSTTPSATGSGASSPASTSNPSQNSTPENQQSSNYIGDALKVAQNFTDLVA